MDRANSQINNLMEQAAGIARRCKEAARETEPTESYKREQIAALEDFAELHDLWIDIHKYNNITFIGKGGENEVYHDGNTSVVKLNNFEYAGDDIENFFVRISAHNIFFTNVPYDLIGFSYNNQHEFCAVLTQPYIKAEREATEEEISAHMVAIGFEMDAYDEFHNQTYNIFDAVPNNVLYGIDGNLYFIDTQIMLR
jgi:hypothetical protein